jgi:serine protease Do
MSLWRSKLAVAVLSGAAVAGGFFGGAAFLDHVQFARAEAQVESSRDQLSHVEDLSSVFREVNKVVEPSVVKIEVVKMVKMPHGDMPDQDSIRRFFHDFGQGGQGGDAPDVPQGGEQDFEQDGTGSGVIMETGDGYGYIVTNNHVAGGATDIKITLSDGRVIDHGKLMGADPKSDLAVVRIKADDLIPAHWGDSDDLEQGDWVLAFGSPLGYSGSMTHGIVSALNRNDVHIIDQGYENFIQVDAPINPGNSGGPLVNLHGEVVGINTAIASRTGFFQGIGFAIPSNQAHRVFDTLKEHGKVVRGWLGISIRDVSSELGLAHSFGYTQDDGVLVEDIFPGTPAYGILNAGDIVTAYNGKPIHDVEHLRGMVADTAPGAQAKLTIYRHRENEDKGHVEDVTLTIGNQPEKMDLADSGQAQPNQAPDQESFAAKSMGIELQNLTPDVAHQLGLNEDTSGAVITSVEPGSLASQAGLRTGLVITHVGDAQVSNAREASNALSRADLGKGIRLRVQTPEGSMFVFLQSQVQSPAN